METTISEVLKHGGPSTVVLVALLIVWADLNGALDELRAEMVNGDQAIRTEMNAGFQAIRAEMAEEFKAVRADVSALGERLARVETRLYSIEDWLYTDTSRPPL